MDINKTLDDFREELNELDITIYEVLHEMTKIEQNLIICQLKLMRRVSELESKESEDD